MIKIAVVVLSTVLFLKAQHALLGEADPLSILEGVALVLLGPLFSVMLSHPHDVLRRLWREILALRRHQGGSQEGELLGQIRRLAKVWQESGPKELEEASKKIANPFLRKGVDMVIDGYAPDDIRRILEKNYDFYLSRKEALAGILSSLTRLPQSFGFIGTVVGLINVLGHLNDKASIGPGVSVALFSTLYGLLFANFLFMPLYKKYAERVRDEVSSFPLITEGVLGLANRESSRHLHYKLESCLEDGEAPEASAPAPQPKTRRHRIAPASFSFVRVFSFLS
ncbi:MAG: MotA/TolQ/ExbB proton channel family protein [Desulfobulbaceae bacterium]|nr:MotA/TolQ/ExbB proton channel family protein [Desulfobulbaceae bacterium]HIJ89771.1 MotA/TolQ/ExbB proton channel family protein [Deltaproteobacteria bacterium]